jgi:DNA uptake protein ComE-like DNA-binding protein
VDDVLIAALFGHSLSYEQAMELEQKVSRHGLSRIVEIPAGGYRISVPYIWIKLLSSFSQSGLLQRFAFLSEMNDSCSDGPHWQGWETFNVNILAIKSFIFANGNAVPVQTLHNGAKWGNRTMTDLINVNQLHVQEAVHQISTNDFDVNQSIQCQQSNDIVPSNGSELIMNASSAPAADSFCCRRIVNGPTILESHQYKLQQQVLSQADLITERDKAVPPPTTPSLFLLITSSDSNVSDLPPNCGLVDRSCYEAYFGPYAARAFIHNKVYANLASKKSLMSVPGIGETRATAILTNRPFSGAADCEQRARIPIDVAEYLCFEYW